MAKNLNGQFTFAINNCFSERTNKHDYKAENGQEMGDKIFSYSEKFRLKDMGKMLQTYIKENSPDIKRVEQIGSDTIQGFLNSKMDTCTQQTINTYANSLYKLQEVVNSTYSTCEVSWRQEVAIPTVEKQYATDRGAESVMTREDYNKILEYCQDNPSKSGYAIQLQDFLGIRVEEVARIKLDNIDLNKGIIDIQGKGGRCIEKEIPLDKIGLVKEIIDKNFSNNGFLLEISGKSINRQLDRIEEKLGLEKHSNHDIRRLIAQEKFDGFREEGFSQKESINLTSKWLSHGDDRQAMLEKSYIKIH